MQDPGRRESWMFLILPTCYSIFEFMVCHENMVSPQRPRSLRNKPSSAVRVAKPLWPSPWIGRMWVYNQASFENIWTHNIVTSAKKLKRKRICTRIGRLKYPSFILVYGFDTTRGRSSFFTIYERKSKQKAFWEFWKILPCSCASFIPGDSLEFMFWNSWIFTITSTSCAYFGAAGDIESILHFSGDARIFSGREAKLNSLDSSTL